MKTFPKAIGAFVLVLFGTLASGAAMAQHGGHGYGHGGHGYGYGGVRFGISLGFPLYAPGYYPAPYYGYPAYAYPAYAYPAPAYAYPPAVVESYSPPVYFEQGAAQAAPAPAQAQADWFYCAASRTYYPYVRECPDGWQRVPAQPPSR
ncbi:MAG TPA: hypothetical protein VIJ43_09635 [Burkholderiales bacterium]